MFSWVKSLVGTNSTRTKGLCSPVGFHSISDSCDKLHSRGGDLSSVRWECRRWELRVLFWMCVVCRDELLLSDTLTLNYDHFLNPIND